MPKAVSIRRPRPRRAVQRMKPYSPPTSDRYGKVRLDFNENTVGCSPRVARVLKSRVARDFLAVYPEYEKARQKMAGFFGVKSDRILFTNGTDEAIHLLVSTYVDDGGEVVIPSPTYAMFRFYAELAGAALRLIPYRKDLAFPLEEMLSAITAKTRLVLVANPNNPTAGAIRLKEIEAILRRARNAAVLIDEAYYEFCGITALKRLSRFPNLFVSRTFSKVYGLAGLRMGCLFSQAGNIQLVRKGQSPYSVNSIGVMCALEAIEDQDYIRSYVEEALEAREMLRRGLDRLGIRCYPSQANFVLAEFGDSAGQVCGYLREKGLLTRNRSHELPGTVRITAGKKSQARKLLACLREVI